MGLLEPATTAMMDQERARLKAIVGTVVDHWDGPCPATKECLGAVANDIPVALYINPIGLCNVLQAALFELALAEYERRHPDDDAH